MSKCLSLLERFVQPKEYKSSFKILARVVMSEHQVPFLWLWLGGDLNLLDDLDDRDFGCP